MKYFVADPHAELGILQLGEEKVTIHLDGSLEYRDHDSGAVRIVPSDEWSTDFDKAVVGAFNRLRAEIAAKRGETERLEATLNDLVKASPRLARMTRQLNLF